MHIGFARLHKVDISAGRLNHLSVRHHQLNEHAFHSIEFPSPALCFDASRPPRVLFYFSGIRRLQHSHVSI